MKSVYMLICFCYGSQLQDHRVPYIFRWPSGPAEHGASGSRSHTFVSTESGYNEWAFVWGAGIALQVPIKQSKEGKMVLRGLHSQDIS